jgi:IS5 family transposase
MLRIHFLQQWYALPNPAVEEALYKPAAMRRFVGIDLGGKVRRMRRRYVSSDICWGSMAWPTSCLRRSAPEASSQGTIVNATIIAAAPSAKNKANT